MRPIALSPFALAAWFVLADMTSALAAEATPADSPPSATSAQAAGTGRTRPTSSSDRSRRREPARLPDGRPTGVRQGKPTAAPAATPSRPAPTTVERARVAHPSVAKHPAAPVRIPYASPRPAEVASLAHSRDHRYAHPRPHWVRPLPGHPIPPHRWYRPWYTHWWIHPYFRWMHASVVFVGFDFTPDPWGPAWLPPARSGWDWVPGHWAGAIWVPGHWQPVGPPPSWYNHRWHFVPGFWMGPAYIEGYWRQDDRPDWLWIEGQYLADGSYIPGHWEPLSQGPEGYVWERGFWDGQDWIEGFWRPSARAGYRWVSAQYDTDGTYHAGYWEPEVARPGWVWIPGWFDGDNWQPGYWVKQSEYDNADPAAWTPPDGWDDGWDQTGNPPDTESTEGDAPLALPVGAAP